MRSSARRLTPRPLASGQNTSDRARSRGSVRTETGYRPPRPPAKVLIREEVRPRRSSFSRRAARRHLFDASVSIGAQTRPYSLNPQQLTSVRTARLLFSTNTYNSSTPSEKTACGRKCRDRCWLRPLQKILPEIETLRSFSRGMVRGAETSPSAAAARYHKEVVRGDGDATPLLSGLNVRAST